MTSSVADGRILGGRTALCLCPGGITGAMYEVGVLAALDEFFVDFNTSKFDIYVGTSAGAFVAFCLAAGIRPSRLYQSVLDPNDDFLGMRRTDIYRGNLRSLLGVMRDLVSITGTHALESLHRRRLSMSEYLQDLEDALPSGIFSLEHYEKYIELFMERHRLPRHFDEVGPELYIPANDLDTGHRAIFGQGRLKQVAISKAVCASSAIPVFFEPMRIGGRDYIDGAAGKTEHADIALARGADLIIIVNPLVPIRNDSRDETLPTAIGGAQRLRDKGLVTVWDQAGRMETKTKLHQAMRRYQVQFPRAALLLIEPKEEEADMFLQNPMNFAARRRILRYGYESTARALRERRGEFEAALGRHKISCDLGQLSLPQALAG